MNQDDIQFIRNSLSKRWKFWLYFWRIPRLIQTMCDEMERMWAEEDRILKERNDSVKANKSLLQWVHVTHRLSTTPEAIRALFAAGKRLRVILFFAFASTVLAAPPPPLVRNYLTTNQTFLQKGALTNNGLDGWGFFNLTNLAIASDQIWTNDGSSVMIAADTNRVRHYSTKTVFGPTNQPISMTNAGIMFMTLDEGISPGCYGKVSSGAAGAFFYYATNCFVSADDGSWAGGLFDGSHNVGCSNSFARAFDGSHAGGLFDFCNDSFIDVREGSYGGVYFSINRSCSVLAGESSMAFGAINGATNCFIQGLRGGYASGKIGDVTTGTTNASIYASSSIAVGLLPISNERIRAQGDSVGTLAIGRDVVSTNNWTVGIHGTNSTDLSLALANNGIKFLVESNGTITSDSLTASTVLQSDSSKKITSISNGTGALTNNGSGTLGWYDLTTLAPATGGAYIATNNGIGWNTQFYAPTNSAISTDKVSLTVKGIANQTGDLQQWLSSSGTTNAWMSSNGMLYLPINASAPTIGMATSSGNGIAFTSSATIDFYQSGALRTRFSAGAVESTDSIRVGASAGNPDISFYRLSATKAAIGTGVNSGLGSLTVSNLQTMGSCTVTQALANGVATVSLTADDQSVSTTNRSYIQLSSDDGTAGNRTFVLSAGNIVGQVLDLEWTGTNAGELVDDFSATGGGNGRLSGTWTPTQYDVIGLRWNGTDWIERFRSTN